MRLSLAALAAAFCLLTGSAFAQTSALTDGQILGILQEANDLDIANAKLARKKSSNSDVKGFAHRMLADHQQANDAGKAVAKKIKHGSQNSPARDNLKSTGKDTLKSLKDLKGMDFDQAYVKNEVAVHQMVLDTIDNTLTPNAQSEDVKTLLSKIRAVIASHLEHAQKLQETLGKSSS